MPDDGGDARPVQIPSLDIAYREASRVVEMQFEQVDGLDVKASVFMGSAGVVLTLLLGTLAVLPGRGPSPTAVVGLVITGAGAAFLSILLAAASLCYATYKNAPSMEVLVGDEFLLADCAETKKRLIGDFELVFLRNQRVIDLKVRLGIAAVFLFLVSLASAGLAVLLLLSTYGQTH